MQADLVEGSGMIARVQWLDCLDGVECLIVGLGKTRSA